MRKNVVYVLILACSCAFLVVALLDVVVFPRQYDVGRVSEAWREDEVLSAMLGVVGQNRRRIEEFRFPLTYEWQNGEWLFWMVLADEPAARRGSEWCSGEVRFGKSKEGEWELWVGFSSGACYRLVLRPGPLAFARETGGRGVSSSGSQVRWFCVTPRKRVAGPQLSTQSDGSR